MARLGQGNLKFAVLFTAVTIFVPWTMASPNAPLAGFLTAMGFDPTWALGGLRLTVGRQTTETDIDTALDRLAVEEVHLIITGLHMPEMDGIEATRIVRATQGAADLPILAVTAKHALTYFRSAPMKGVDFAGTLESWRMYPKDRPELEILVEDLVDTGLSLSVRISSLSGA